MTPLDPHTFHTFCAIFTGIGVCIALALVTGERCVSTPVGALSWLIHRALLAGSALNFISSFTLATGSDRDWQIVISTICFLCTILVVDGAVKCVLLILTRNALLTIDLDADSRAARRAKVGFAICWALEVCF